MVSKEEIFSQYSRKIRETKDIEVKRRLLNELEYKLGPLESLHPDLRERYKILKGTAMGF